MPVLIRKEYTLQFSSVQELLEYEKGIGVTTPKPGINTKGPIEQALDAERKSATKNKSHTRNYNKQRTKEKWRRTAMEIAGILERGEERSISGAYRRLTGSTMAGPYIKLIKEFLVEAGKGDLTKRRRKDKKKKRKYTRRQPVLDEFRSKEEMLTQKMEEKNEQWKLEDAEEIDEELTLEDSSPKDVPPKLSALDLTDNLDAEVMFYNMLKKCMMFPVSSKLTYEMEGSLLGFKKRSHWNQLCFEVSQKKEAVAKYLKAPQLFVVENQEKIYYSREGEEK